MDILAFFKEYDIWKWVFSVASAVLAYIVIRFIEKFFFLIRSRQRLKLLNINCFLQRDKTNYPCKLWIDFRNWTNMTLLMRIEGYEVARDIQPDPKAARDSTSGLLEIKFIENPSQRNDSLTLNVDAIIRHGENKKVWVPLDPKQSDDTLEKALKEGKIGKLKGEILWFADKSHFVRYRPIIRRP